MQGFHNLLRFHLARESVLTPYPRHALRRAWPDLVVAGLLALVILGPLLFDRGFVLVADMVFVPDQPWKDAWTGGDGGVPRAVPSDAWVALLDSLIPGALLQRLVLVSIVGGASLGMALLVADHPPLARIAASVLYVWNPFVFERLAIGHWALLCGYAALPWVAWAAVRLREHGAERDRGRAWGVLAFSLAVAGWASPTGGVLTAVTAVVLLVPRWPSALRVLGLGLFVNLPWIVPALANGADQLAPDPFGAEAFAARADTPFGVLGSLLTFGGIWKESIIPDNRQTWWMVLVALMLVTIAVWGLVRGRRTAALPLAPALALAVGSLLLALVGGVDWMRPVTEWIVLRVPGGGLLRDGQKWVAPWVMVVSVGFASAVRRMGEWSVRSQQVGQGWMLSLLLLPVIALPSLAFGLGGFLHSDPYPAQWFEMRDEMERLDLAEDLVVVLPFSTYRRFDWTARTVLDPAPRFFPGRMVTDDALSVPRGTVGGESALAARVRAAETGDELAAALSDAGVRWALVHRSTDPGLTPSGAVQVSAGDQLTLLRLEEPTGEPAMAGGPRAVTYVMLDLMVLCGTVVGAVRVALR